MSETVTVELTEPERQVLLAGLMYCNAYFGPPPDPPTPGMTAQAKLEKVAPHGQASSPA